MQDTHIAGVAVSTSPGSCPGTLQAHGYPTPQASDIILAFEQMQ